MIWQLGDRSGDWAAVQLRSDGYLNRTRKREERKKTGRARVGEKPWSVAVSEGNGRKESRMGLRFLLSGTNGKACGSVY